jgi:hypothetical protein
VRLLTHGATMPGQGTEPWLTLVPVSASRSSYNGLVLLVFIGLSASLTAVAIHRLAARRTRRSAAWDCGHPDASPLIQYSAGSFAQPLRRVFGTTVFRAREAVDMPPPGDPRPARLQVSMRDLVWDELYLPIGQAIRFGAGRLNEFQFLTIRRYLSLVFGALVALLLVIALWR